MEKVKSFEEFVNEGIFSTHYGKNDKNKHLYFALKKVLIFCEENKLVYQTAGSFCGGLKFDKINIFKDGTKNIDNTINRGGIKECIARIYANDDGNVIYWCNGVEYKSCSELFSSILENR